MKWSDVLKEYGQYDKTNIENKLNALGDWLFTNWSFADMINSCSITDEDFFVTGYVNDQLPKVLIGDKLLRLGCDSGERNKAEYVRLVNIMFHEYRHGEQHAAAHLKGPLDSEMENIVRRQFVRIFYPSIYKMNYVNDPGETDAILYSLKETLNYFESDPILSKEAAEDILFKYMTIDHNKIYQSVLKFYHPESIYDVISAYEDINNTACDIKYDFNPEESSRWDMTHEFVWDPDYEKDRNEFENAKTGREQDTILERTIVLAHPDAIERIPALKNELNLLLEQYSEEDFMKSVESIPVSNEPLNPAI